MLDILTVKTIGRPDGFYYNTRFLYNPDDFSITAVKTERHDYEKRYEPVTWKTKLTDSEVDKFISKWIDDPEYHDILTQIRRDINLSKL